MLEKLSRMEKNYTELADSLSDPAVLADNRLYAEKMREYKRMTPIIETYHAYLHAMQQRDEAKELLQENDGDAELKELAQEEYHTAKAACEDLHEKLIFLLLPQDPNDDKNVIIEIRSGAGGEEAALFANSLYRMYTMYAESKGWKQEVLNQNPTELGGFKEISFSIVGEGAYSKLKYESGVHRVQRVPETESQGRIHTSTVTVAVLVEADDVELNINPDTEKKTDKATRIEANLEPLNREGNLIFNEDEQQNPHMQRLTDQFKLFTLRLKFPADGPDCIEGANRIIDRKARQSEKPVIVTRKSTRSQNKYRV